jgi:predicted transcriptional regulator
MKSILMSIQPKWVKKIINGKKTIEVRKTAPKEAPFRAYIYCTGVKNLNLAILKPYSAYVKIYRETGGAIDYWHGKVVAEFVCDKVESIPVDSEAFAAISKPACLTTDELIRYCSGKDMYGLHISDLKIYDKPRELGEFRVIRERSYYANPYDVSSYRTISRYEPITRPPQSWQYVGEIEE